MKDTTLRGHLATLGLGMILLVFAVSSICTTMIVRGASQQASEAVHMSDLYQQAHYLVSSESSMMHEYTLQPGFDEQEKFHEVTWALNDVLDSIVHVGDSGDYAFVKKAKAMEVHYVLLADEFFALVDERDLPDALAYHNNTVEPFIDSIEELVGNATNSDQQLAVQSLAHMDITQRLAIVSIVLVFVIGLVLILIFWRVIRGYQHRLYLLTQEELQHMEQVALTDPLTGLPNHRTMMDQIDKELAHCQRTQESCAVVFVDLDHFKHINDTWGHRAGDMVLREASSRLKKDIRPGDMVGRYGGEEFVMILSNMNIQTAKQAVERFRIALAEEPCILEPGEGILVRNSIAFTASIGVAVYGEHGTTREALIEAADRAMYYAKQNGRNQVCLAGEETALTSQVLASISQRQFTETIGVKTLTAVATVHDGETSAHARRMVRLAEETARGLGRSEEEIHLVRLAALFHDIGKIGIPDTILHKPGPLTEEEWTVMRRHPVLGQHILEQVGGLFELLSHIVVAHHEHWDGRGYPHGLSQEAIPLGARILTVVDSYDAMTSERSYRKPLSDARARAELQHCAGSQYDPQVVEVFLHVLDGIERQLMPAFTDDSQDNSTSSQVIEEISDCEALSI